MQFGDPTVVAGIPHPAAPDPSTHVEVGLVYAPVMGTHEYSIELHWDGSGGAGTTTYEHYERQFRIRIAGKPELIGSADRVFCGDPTRHNPEDLLVAALSSCHMLAYLALCARQGIRVVGYRDAACGRMRLSHHGGGRFEEVTLRPHVTIEPGDDLALARAIHDRAHATCFIASSCNFPVICEPSIDHAAADRRIAEPRLRRDLAVKLPNRPGALAELGELLGRAGISLEGGGGFAITDHGIVHFLVADAKRAAGVLRAGGLEVLGICDVIVHRLEQEVPGQLGKVARAMADAGVNIECVYSDHEHQLILCVDDLDAAARVTAAWHDRSAPA